jgi:hypothetical protein
MYNVQCTYCELLSKVDNLDQYFLAVLRLIALGSSKLQSCNTVDFKRPRQKLRNCTNVDMTLGHSLVALWAQ